LCKKRGEGSEPTFHEPDSILLAWYQDACISGIPEHEKVKKIVTRRHNDNFAVSNGWSVTAWYTKSLLEKVPPMTRPVLEVVYLCLWKEMSHETKTVHKSCAFSTVASWKEY